VSGKTVTGALHRVRRALKGRADAGMEAGRNDGGEALWLACSRKDGLGARLLNLVWSWRMARKIGARLIVFWPPFPAQYGEGLTAADIFDVFALAASPLRDEIQILDARANACADIREINLDAFERCDVRPFARTWPLGPGDALPVVCSFAKPPLAEGETLDDALAEAKALFAKLPIRPNILRALERACAAHELGRTVAIHVRRGDIVEALRSSRTELASGVCEPDSLFQRCTTNFMRLCVPLESYLRALESDIGAGSQILLFTDTPELSGHFRAACGARLRLAGEFAPAALSEHQRAFFELLLMGRCRRVAGSRSAFGQAAAVIGGAEFVDARQYSTAEEMIDAYLEVVEYHDQAPPVKAAMADALHRSLGKQDHGFKAWRVSKSELQALLDAAAQRTGARGPEPSLSR
jgi:hypothetical protein